MASLFKIGRSKIRILLDNDMILMVEEEVRGGICQIFHMNAKANNKYMRNYHKRTIVSYIMYLDANNLYGWAMSQKLPVTDFKWVKDLSKFNECFIKIIMKTVMRYIFLK